MEASRNEELSPSQPISKKRHHAEPACLNGNYLNYYSQRQSGADDARLDLLQADWFKDKKCIDLGCNDGTFTRQIAKSFGCQLMLGVDIDARCIHSAWSHTSLSGGADEVASSTKASESPARGNEDKEQTISAKSTSSSDLGSSACSWLRADLSADQGSAEDPFAGPLGASVGTFDTVTCFSVAKWVHLVRGDEGLVLFFQRVLQLLKPGGRFVFEPQDWASYKKNKTSSDTARLSMRDIKLRPSGFPELMLGNDVGFATCTPVTSVSSSGGGQEKSDDGTFKGRPVYVLMKAVSA